MLLKEVDDIGATVAWSPCKGSGNLIALGSKHGAGGGFDDTGGLLQIHELDFADAQSRTPAPLGTYKTKCVRLRA